MLIFITTILSQGVIKGFSEDLSSYMGLISFFIFLVPAVALFIYSGMKLEKFSYLRKDFTISPQTKSIIEEKHNAFLPVHTLTIIIGVCLCIISPVAIFTASFFGENATIYGVVILLMIIAVAVFIFVYYGSIKESFNILLKLGDYSKEKVEENKVIGAAAAVVWPLVTCIFLICGFIFHLWYICWIVFPITGILFGMFTAVYNIFKGNSK